MTKPVVPVMIVCAALIRRKDGRFLIARRPEGSTLAGWWEFPGGKAEPGEDPRRALERECAEELGVTVRAHDIYEVIHVFDGRRTILLLFYETELIEGEPRSMEGNELAWTTPEEMRTFQILEPDQPLIDRLARIPLRLHQES